MHEKILFRKESTLLIELYDSLGRVYGVFCIYFMGINKVRLLRLFEMRLLLLILSKCLHVIAVGFLPISTAIFAKNSFICNYLYLDRFEKIISDVT